MRYHHMHIALLRDHMMRGGSVMVTTMELTRDDVARRLTPMTYTERDAEDQLASARRAAVAWLRTTLAAMPAEVTSLSVGAVLEDADDRPSLAPRLRAEVCTPEITLRYPDDYPAEEMECLDALDDCLVEVTRPFLFAIGDEEWITVTRADLATAGGESL